MPPTQKDHLSQRGTTYHCRIDVPDDLRPAFGNRRVLSKSLKTGDKMLAKELASVQVGQWKAEFRAVRDAKLKVGDKWREVLASESVSREGGFQKLVLDRVRGGNNGAATEEEREEIFDSYKQAIQLATTLESLGLPDCQSRMTTAIVREIRSPSSIDALSEVSGLLEEMNAFAVAHSYNLNSEEKEEASAISRNPTTYKPKSPISSTNIDTFASFYATQNPKVRTRDIYVSQIRRFSKWLTTEGRTLDWDAVAEYLDSIGTVRQTRQGHLAALRRYHEWAIRYDAYYRELFREKRSAFDNHTHARVGTDSGESWTAFTRQEVDKLHASAVTKGDTELSDLIAFAGYTGCRIEEIGRVRAGTTIFENGVPVGFKVDDAKTKAGVREVPIHSALLPLYLRRLASPCGPSEFLFKGNDTHKHNLRLSAVSQRFSKLKTEAGFDRLQVFHSIRKATVTLLVQAGASPVLIPNIVGHDVGSITFDLYSAGASMDQKREAIELLAYSFNL